MSTADLPELLPCPFCGEHFVEEAESDVPTIHGGNMRAVYCNGCFAEGPTADTPAEAIAAWNTRAGDKRAREAGAAEWIDVNDRLPPKNTEVLIAFRDSTLPATGQYTAHRCDHDGWSYPGENDPEEVGPVTYWMPLPEHPAPPAASPSPDMLEKK